MSLSEDESFSDTPQESNDGLTENTDNLIIPTKSRDIYLQSYDQFMNWRKTRNTESFSENVILVYFTELAKEKKSSTLWKIYSMLRTTIIVKHNIDLAQYTRLRAYLKKQSQGYHAKKSKTLTAEQINKFIQEAPDEMYLDIKVALIVGITGACRKRELHQLKMHHIQDLGTQILISVPDTKKKFTRKFTVTGTFYDIFKKYAALRPENTEQSNFFLNYQKGRCTRQVIGINKLGSMPKQVATFLKLENPELFTGHCFRRSSATMLVDDIVDINNTLQSYDQWKPSEVTGYLNNSLNDRLCKPKEIKTEFIDSDSSNEYPSTLLFQSSDGGTILSKHDITATVKRQGGQKSSYTPEGCLNNSLNDRLNVANAIKTELIEPESSNKCSSTLTFQSADGIINLSDYVANAPSLTFKNCTNVTINIINNKEQ